MRANNEKTQDQIGLGFSSFLEKSISPQTLDDSWKQGIEDASGIHPARQIDFPGIGQHFADNFAGNSIRVEHEPFHIFGISSGTVCDIEEVSRNRPRVDGRNIDI